MKQFILSLLLLTLVHLAHSQLRYTETVFEKSDTIKNVEFAMADWLNSSVGLLSEYNIHSSENKVDARPLYMDIYSPHGDTVTKRPAIIFAFSGGFLIGSRHHDDMIAFCDSFAQRGYVTTTMDYRIGMSANVSRVFGIPYKVAISEYHGTRSVYRAIQDSRAAVRFLKHNAETYGIDTTKIYMVGSSAGAFVALQNMYMDKNSEIPEYALSSPNLGNLDTVGVQGYNGQADAIVSMWGALQTPDLIESESKPAFLIHGKKDSIVYFKKGIPLKSLVPDLEALEFNMPETYGGFCVDTALTNRSIPHKSYFVSDKKHEFYGVDTGMFGEDGPNQYWDSIHWKISDFLFDIFKPDAEFNYETNDITLTCFNQTLNSTFAEWDLGDGNSLTGNEVRHTYSQPGEYMVTLTTCNTNMACDTLTQKVKVGNSVGVESRLSENLRIYPNPAQNTLNIDELNTEFSFRIIDLMGRTHIHNQQYFSNSIDVSSLINGIYILRIETNKETIVRKFQKTN